MEFEWDEAKNAANRVKHGIAFEMAAAVFLDEGHVTSEDVRYQYDEPRLTAIGSIDGRLHVVIYTLRGEIVRIISARKANRREQRKHGYRSL
jgi:uncharacterized DUF497 family protein